MRYRYFDFTLDSDIRFPELEPAHACTRTLLLRLSESIDAAGTDTHAPSVPRVRADNGQPWLSIGRAGEAFRLEFHGLVTLQYDTPRVSWTRRAAALRDDSLRHLLLDQALPLIAAHEGDTVLHAACAAVDGRAVLLAGPAGAGKSTLIAHLMSNGWDLAADDAAAIRVQSSGVLVQPAYAGIRLWPDSREALNYSEALDYRDGVEVAHDPEKRRFCSGVLPEGALPLVGVYLLNPDGVSTPALRLLSRRDAVVALLRNSFVLDVSDHRRAEAQLEALTAIASRVPVAELRMPHQFEALASVRATIERELIGVPR